MNTVVDNGLLPAWGNPVHDAQSTFRSILKALAEPGKVQVLPVHVSGPAPLGLAATALSLTLLDLETSVWVEGAGDLSSVRSYLRFHCGCALADKPDDATFALILDGEQGFDMTMFSRGDMEYPDRGATLLVQVPSLESGPHRTISGPGIRNTETLKVAGLPDNFDAMWRDNAAGFPLGVDIIFCCDNAIVTLPRTSQIHI